MSGLLSLKWNNHSTIFLNLLQNLRLKELYCDTTIVCQGKFFPVHKLVLSTCSEYFEEIFERIDCKHPFIIMKDVEIQQLEALLNYMYKGEVNVLQDCLSGLIKAAEALKIKGLAVPDQVNTGSESPVNLNSHSSLSPNSVNKTSSDNDQQNHAAAANKEKVSDWGQKDAKLISKEYSNASEDLQTIVKSEPIDFINDCSDKQTNVDPLNFASLLPNEAERDNPSKDEETVQQLKSNLTSSPASSYSMSDNLNDSSIHADESCHLWQDVASTSTEERIQRNSMLKEMSSGNDYFPLPFVKNVRSKKRFDHSKELTLHSPFRHRCSFCPYGSYSSSAVRKHEMRIHTGVKPFKCIQCPYSCTTKEGLRIHFRTHTGEKPYKCQKCFYKSSCYANLKKHVQTVHKI